MDLTRRNLVAAGGFGAFAMVAARTAGAADAPMAPVQLSQAPAGPAPAGQTPNLDAPSAASPGVIEKSNIQLVKDFCKGWGDDPPSAEDLVNHYLSDDCLVRFGETIDPVTGHDAAIALFQTFLNNGERYELKILETFARGPLVVNSRIDSTIKGKHATNPTKVFGVFVVKNGKIKEWSDFV